MRKLIVAAFVALSLSACGPSPQSSEEIQNHNQEVANKQAVNAVGMPSTPRWTEKRLLKDILEMRDKSLATVTYTKDLAGHAHKFCDSVGFPLPYATQFTNPMQPGYYSSTVIPQADPNGLYSPASAEGTWVMCVGKKSHKAHPAYIEDRVFTVIANDDYDGLH